MKSDDVFRRHSRQIYVTALTYVKNRSDAEDILQDSFVRLWRRQYPLKSEKEAEALLNKTVRNASLNERRRERTVPLEIDYPDDRPDTTEKEKAYAEMERKIQSELTATQQYILKEKEYGGRTLEDIAKELKMEPTAVRMQLSRARKTLRNALKDDR